MFMVIHFFSGSFAVLNYITDLVIVAGAFFSGYRWYDRRQKNRQAKEDAAEQTRIDTIVKASVDASILRVMTNVDTLVEKSVKDELSNVNDRMNKQDAVLAVLEHEVTFNDGSSMKDSQKRTENAINLAATALEGLRESMISQKEIMHGQSVIIEKIEMRQNDLANTMASHIGAHSGLPDSGKN
jgi:hypothetical protein